jgi:hypothetical protein
MADIIQLIVDYSLWLYVLCGLGILVYFRAVLRARGERKASLFTLEREAASSRAARGLAGMFLFMGLAGSVYFVEEMVAPRIPEPLETEEESAIQTVFLITPTSNDALVPTASPTVPLPTDTPEPTATATRLVAPTTPPTPEPTAAPVAACSGAARITSPGVGAALSGEVGIYGTAAASDFNFYKVEYHREGEPDDAWHSLSDVHRQQVLNGLLDVWNVGGFPAGRYRLKLTIVDVTGNYPPHYRCEVPVTVPP